MASKSTSRNGAAASTQGRKRSPRGAASAQRAKAPARSRVSSARPNARKPAPVRGGTRPRRRAWIAPLTFAALVVFAAWSFYPVARVQYGEQRQKARLEAELASLKERNGNLRAEVDRLKTPEGVEEVARESLGLVKEGENVYVVIDGDEAESTPTLTPDTASAAPQDESVWLAVLDAIFGFE